MRHLQNTGSPEVVEYKSSRFRWAGTGGLNNKSMDGTRLTKSPPKELCAEILFSVCVNKGCVVAVIVWDDQSSWDTPFIGDMLEKGMMLTHDEATFKVRDERIHCHGRMIVRCASEASCNNTGVFEFS